MRLRQSKGKNKVNSCIQPGKMLQLALLSVLALLSFSASSTRTESLSQTDLTEFATRYAQAGSGKNPENLASFYAEDGRLTVNEGDPAIGRTAIAAKAREFMEAFSDMVVKTDSVSQDGNQATFHWTWTGTNTGPGGTGKPVRISGYEEWTFGPEGMIVESQGHYDAAEYQRQMSTDRLD